MIRTNDTPAILSTATAVPDQMITQAEVLEILERAKARTLPPRMAEILGNTGIKQRYIAMPPEYYFADRNWADRAAVYEAAAMDLFERAASSALQRAGRTAADIGQIVCVSTTGVMTPSLPSRMIERMGFCGDTRTVPLFGYGCAGGVIGLGIAADLARADPVKPVLLVALELCSMAYDHSRMDKKDMVATALFADGCAAAVIGAGEGPRLAAFAQNTWPDTLDMMGWGIGDTGFDLVLARDIPAFIASGFAPVCDGFLAAHGLSKGDIAEPICHPGGGRVVDALGDYFGHALPATRFILAHYGNMSSPTVLFVLDAILRQGPIEKPAILTALGPGFTGAMGLLEP
ncbi:type III polyketide synthase [Sphingorhabdus arenilitoris]|uniref:Type III polyketide synthase n=1 Tax=Sphingorhabdus arenilitoris TaxID=1490041 RepID=A0ABV8RCN3_9SPHN